MSNRIGNPLVLGGAVLILLGVAGLAVPVFATHQLTDVARIGDLKVQAEQNTTHVVPQVLSLAALILGVAVAAIGVTRAPA